jgi:glycerol-3-phosphate dehydrogenase
MTSCMRQIISCICDMQVIPTPFVAKTIEPLAGVMTPKQILVSCTKGILNDTLETPNQVLLLL